MFQHVPMVTRQTAIAKGNHRILVVVAAAVPLQPQTNATSAGRQGIGVPVSYPLFSIDAHY